MAIVRTTPIKNSPFFVQYKSGADTPAVTPISSMASSAATTPLVGPVQTPAPEKPTFTSKTEEVAYYNAPSGSAIPTDVVKGILTQNTTKNSDPNVLTGDKLKTAESKGALSSSIGNMLSINSSIAKGAAALGVTKKDIPDGMTGKTVPSVSGDLVAAAKALGIDTAPYMKTAAGPMGSKQTVIDKLPLYNAINAKANEQGLYAITERVPGTPASNATHTTTLYKDTNGTLQPVIGADGKPATSTFKAPTYTSDPGFFGGLVQGVAGIASELSPILMAMGAANGLNYILNGISSAGVGSATLDAATSAATTAAQNAGVTGNYLTGGLTLPGGATTAGTAALNAGGGVLAPGLGASVGAGGTAIGAGSVGLSSLIPSGLTAGAANLLPTVINAADLIGPNIGASLAGAGGFSLSDLSNVPTSIPGVGTSSGGAINEAVDELPTGPIIDGENTSDVFPYDIPLPGGGSASVDDIAKAVAQNTGLSAADAKNLISNALNKSSLASLLTGAGQGAASIYAADKQYEAAKYAADLQKQMFDIINSQYAPQRGAGYQALGQIRSMLPGQYQQYDETGKPIGTATGTDYLTRQFTPQDLYAGLAPNYNFMLQQGQQTAQRQANLAGGGMGGNAQRALQEYTQNYAGNAYQNAFQNFQNQRTNIYNTLAGIAGIGQQAQGTTSQAGQNMATNVGQLAVGGAGAQAAGITGAANAVAGGVQNYNANQILQAILGQNQNVAQGGSTATPPFNVA